MKWLLRASLALVALLPPHDGSAQVPNPRPPPHEVLRTQADEIGLDDATLEQIMAIARDARPERQALREAVEIARTQLDAVLLVDEPEEAEVIATLEMLADAELALRTHDLLTLIAMRSLLTVEQREIFATLFDQPAASGVGGRPPGLWLPPGPPPDGHEGPPGRP